MPASAQVGGPCIDGDVNGDLGLDISDPIYLLRHLFEGGPAPMACAQTPTSMELESVLAKFFPRHLDWVHVATPAFTAPNQTISLFTVPPGKVLMVTLVRGESANAVVNDDEPILLKNGLLFEARAVRQNMQPGFTLSPDSPRVACLPGDVLEVEGEPGRWLELYGYLTDAP